jgi:hypothetical protein
MAGHHFICGLGWLTAAVAVVTIGSGPIVATTDSRLVLGTDNAINDSGIV